MAKKFGPTIKKLQNAINGTGKLHITINKTQYYVEQDNKVAEVIIVKQATPDEKTGKVRYDEIFSSGSDVAIVLYLRDLWYELNGWDIPTDNEKWNETKRKYEVRKQNKLQKGMSVHG